MKPAMAELYACIFVREFPAQAMLRLRPALRQNPVAVVEGEPPRQFVCSHNARARQLGVEHGMTRAELDVFPTVTQLRRSQTEEDGARAALLQCASHFSPRVEERSEETSFCCLLDLAGTEKLLGSPEDAARKLLHQIRSLGVQGTVVIGANAEAACCLGRSFHAGSAVIPSGEEARALASLPLAVLPLTAEETETFARWGIHTLGALAALPEKELTARLRQQGRKLRQLARGEAQHLLLPAAAAFVLEEQMELDAPVELLDSLLFVLGAMLDQLIARAAGQILALAAVTAELTIEGGGTHMRTVRSALPGNDRRLWLKLLHLDLQAHPPTAAILAVRLSAEPGSTRQVQLGLFSPQLPEPSRLDVTLARIRSVVGGEDRVGCAVLEDSYRTDAFRMAPFSVAQTPPVAAASRGRSRRAVRRLRPAEAVEVTVRQRQPVSFVFRAQRYLVEQTYGPWFSSGHWWGAGIWSVEKWDLVAHCGDAVLCCCLARHPGGAVGKQNWRIEALYD